MSKLHLLHVVPTLRAGGMEMALSRVVNGLLAEEMSHTIVVLKGEAIIRDLFDPAVHIHCFHARPHDASVPVQLHRLIHAERPSVIHARNLGAWFDVALARLSVWPVTPLVFSFHGLAETKPLSWRWRLMSRALARATSFIFTVSHGSKRFLTDEMRVPASRVAVIPNGVDTTRFFPLPPPSPHRECRVGTLGSLTPVKNQAMLIKACSRLLQEGCDLRLDIAGEGPERPALEHLIQSLGMAEKIRLTGHIADTPGFLRALDVFVLPSDSEAHPNALSEAMACGLPCLASRVGGIPEILDDGRGGMMFDPGDERGLAAGLQTLLGSPAIRQAFGAAAWKRIREHYSLHVMMESYRTLYLRLSGVAANSKTSAPLARKGL